MLSSSVDLAKNPVHWYCLPQRCDSSSWTGTATTCRAFPSRSNDCQTPNNHFTQHTLALVALTPTDHTAAPVAALTSLSPNDGLRNGVPDHHATDNDDEMWTFCDSWITAG